MKILRELDPLQVLALVLLAVPAFGVVALGMVALWRSDHTLWWLGGFACSALAGYGVQQWCVRRERRVLVAAETVANPDWPPAADAVWASVDALAERLQADDWPLDDGERLLTLGRQTLETVARAYHPDTEQPVLELTLPHALMIVERACRDLRADIVEYVPFSHRLTIGDVLRVQRWKRQAEKVYDVYRAGRVVFNPLDALIGEAWRQVRNRSFGLARIELHRWLLRTYVRKVGYYAIDLYSGRLPLDGVEGEEGAATDARADSSAKRKSEGQSENPTGGPHTADTPLSIVVLGRRNAGKSSLINALFGRLTAASDVLADTTSTITALPLEREGLTRATVYDTPGFDGVDAAGEADERLLELIDEADLLLWVSAVNRPDREHERAFLDRVRARLAARRDRRPPPLIVIASGIDRVRPAAEWAPPYDLAASDRPKAVSIRAATEAVAADLAVEPAAVVPACLAEGRYYNVDDGVWSAILAQQDEALRVRLLRCLQAQRRHQNWALLTRQLLASGRLLGTLPQQLFERVRR